MFIYDVIGKFLLKRLETEKQRVVKLRWEQARLEQIVRELEARKGEKKDVK